MMRCVLMLCLFGSCFCLNDIATMTTGLLDELKELNFSLSDLAANVPNISSSCMIALKGMKKMDAVKYLDNTGKPASGLTDGNLQWLGNYEACVKMDKAQYCYSQLYVYFQKAKQLQSISWGICAPKACTEQDLSEGLDAIINIIKDLNIAKNLGFGDVKKGSKVACAVDSHYDAGAVATLVLIGILVVLVVCGTCFDMVTSMFPCRKDPNGELGMMHSSNGSIDQESLRDAVQLNSDQLPLVEHQSPRTGILSKIMLSFSAIKNIDIIMSTKVAPNAITCINGIRVISMFWVILGHTFLFCIYTGTVDNGLSMIPVLQSFSFLAVDNAFVSVDSFFFLSGLLVGYLGWKRMEKNNGGFPIIAFYVHRYLRLTPSVLFVILFSTNLQAFLGKGPVWYKMQLEESTAACRKYWWTNILYINNFYPNSLGSECVGWTWYLANDMQFYIISPLILFLAYRFRWAGALISLTFLGLISTVITIVLMAVHNLSALSSYVGADQTKSGQYSDMIYIKPYCRITPYLIGMFVGYLFFKNCNIFSLIQRGRASKFKKQATWVLNLYGWVMALVFAMLIVYGPYSMYKAGGTVFNKAEDLLYGGFFRSIWGICLAWVVYSSYYGYGGQINRFLSARYWMPLSRLTYGAYLVHPVVLIVFFFAFETPVHFTYRLTAIYFIGSTALSYGAAFLLALFLEVPLTNIEKIVFKF